eukprot:gene12815-biopygen6501
MHCALLPGDVTDDRRGPGKKRPLCRMDSDRRWSRAAPFVAPLQEGGMRRAVLFWGRCAARRTSRVTQQPTHRASAERPPFARPLPMLSRASARRPLCGAVRCVAVKVGWGLTH